MEKQARINEILEKRNKSLDVDILAGYQDEPIPEPSPRFTKLIKVCHLDLYLDGMPHFLTQRINGTRHGAVGIKVGIL